MIFAFVSIPKVKSPKVELQELQIEATKLRIEILKRNLSTDVITIKDLKIIYSCVDTKIQNEHSEIKSQCNSLRDNSIGARKSTPSIAA